MSWYQGWIAFITIVIHEVQRVFRIWSQTLLPPAITSILYFVIFGQVIGSRIGDMEGFRYIQYIAPGLIMMNIITASYSSAVSSFYAAKFQRSIEELLVAPMPNTVILLGYMSGGILRGVLVGIIVSVIALFFTHLHVHSFFSIALVVLLSSSIFSLAGIINAIYAKSFDDIALIPTFILTPLTYLGGVFYSIKLLPQTWQYISLANPIIYIVDNFRYGFLGIADSHIALAYVLMAALLLALFFLAFYLLRRGVGLRE